jgi:Glycosyltransferase family 87
MRWRRALSGTVLRPCYDCRANATFRCDPTGRLAARTAALLFVVPIMISFVPSHFYLVALPLCAFLFVLVRSLRACNRPNPWRAVAGYRGESMMIRPEIENKVLMPADAPYYVRGLALGLCAFLIGAHLWTWVLEVPFYMGGHSDFRQLYAGGYMIRTGQRHSLYDLPSQKRVQDAVVSLEKEAYPLPTNHPAYEEVLFAVLSLLPYKPAYFVFLAFNLVLLGLSYYLLRDRMKNLRIVYPWLPLAMFVAFLPVAAALVQGQDSVLLLLLLTGAVVALDREHDSAAGFLVGLGLFKFQLALPIAFLFLTWKRWRFCKGFSFAAVLTGGLSLCLIGWDQLRAYINLVLFMGRSSPGQGYPLVVQRMANLHGLVYGAAGNRLSLVWVVASTALASAIVFGIAIKWTPSRTGSDAILLATVVATLVSYHLFIHDLSVMFIPIVLTLDRYLPAERSGTTHDRLVVRIAAFTFVAPLLYSYAPDHFYLLSLPLLAFAFALSLRCRIGADRGARVPGAVGFGPL